MPKNCDVSYWYMRAGTHVRLRQTNCTAPPTRGIHRTLSWTRQVQLRLFFFKSFIARSIYSVIIHLAVCLTTGPKPLPKRALHLGRSRTSSFKWEYPLLSLRSSSSFLRLLPRLPVTSIPPFIFPSITRYRMQFLRKMWPIQFAFRLRISCRILYSVYKDKLQNCSFNQSD